MGRHIPDNTDAAAQAADDSWSERGLDIELDREPVATTVYEIFGSKDCNYCVKAQQFFGQNGIDYKYYDLEDDDYFDQLVGRIKTWKTVPQIFYGPNHIGSYDDLIRYLEPILPKSDYFKLEPVSTWCFRVTNEGKLQFNPDIPQDEAAREGIKALQNIWADGRGVQRNDELLEANTRYLLRARTSEDLLFKLYETHTMNVKPSEELLTEIGNNLNKPWL